MTATVHKRIAKHLAMANGSVAGKNVLALCSGGADSTALVSLLATLPRSSAPRSITVLHLDHGYRTASPESLAEMDAARAVAARYNLKFISITRDPATDPFDTKKSKQDDARSWRYKMSTEAAANTHCPIIATGHTASDNVENALMHLAGILLSPALCATARYSKDTLLVRPILCLTRDEIIEYATAQNITWAEDPTNSDPDAYERNSIRHRVVPALIAHHPQAPQAIIKNAKLFDSMKSSNREMARHLLAAVRTPYGALSTKKLNQFSPSTIRAIIAVWMTEIAPEPRAFNERTVELVASLTAKAGCRATISPSLEIINDKEYLKIIK